MTIRDCIADRIGFKNLEEFIISEFNNGKDEAIAKFDEYILEFNKNIQDIEDDDVKVTVILSEIARNKKDIDKLNSSYFFKIINESNEYYSNQVNSEFNETDEAVRFAKYFINYYDLKGIPNSLVESQLVMIKDYSSLYHSSINYISTSNRLFDILNDICKIEEFTWDWLNFEDGLVKVLIKHTHQLISIKENCKLEIEKFEVKKNFEIDSLKTEIKYLNEDKKALKNEIVMKDSFFDKYYFKSNVFIAQTYFGDNTPFLINLFNFLKKNNLLDYGWSYFYSCMIVNNDEMIPLNKPKKLNFIGRIFYHLTDYLILQYKEQPLQFLKSKFLIDGNYITDSFKNNHMKPYFDKFDDPELMNVDDFFEKQEKIYLKM